MDIKLEKIKQFSDVLIYERGLKYYKQDRVKIVSIEADHFKASVTGSQTYNVSVIKRGKEIYATCDCPYWANCKHMVAALLAARDHYDSMESEQKTTQPEWQTFFDQIIEKRKLKYDLEARNTQKWQLVYVIELNNMSWEIKCQKVYIKKENQLGKFANLNYFSIDDSSIVYAPNDPFIYHFLSHPSSTFYGNTPVNFKYGENNGKLFDLLKESQIFLLSGIDSYQAVKFSNAECNITFNFEEKNDHYFLSPQVIWENNSETLDSRFRVLTQNPIWLYKDLILYRVKNISNTELLLPFSQKNIELNIPKQDFSSFLKNSYQEITRYSPIVLPSSIEQQEFSTFSKKQLYLEEGMGQLYIDLKFLYGDTVVAFEDPREEIQSASQGKIIVIRRDRDKEFDVFNRVLETGLKATRGEGFKLVESHALSWLFENIPVLVKENFEFLGQEKLKKYRVRTGSVNVNAFVSSEIDWFDINLKIDIEGIELSLKEIKKALRQQSRYVVLADKSIGQLSEDWFKKFQHLFNFTRIEENKIKAAKFHISLIDVLLENAQKLESDLVYKKSLKKLKNFDTITIQDSPKTLLGELRPYQKAGYDWLYFLKEYGFGGCLADDMGLGKTIQTLALLLKEKEVGNNKCSLIVCPTSVVYNWEVEANKFAPSLKILQHTGVQREKVIDHFQDYDIVVTSYGILLRDISFLVDYKFYYAILDESQKIKNPLSQTAKATRMLKADHKLALTGTPVENNTLELWSQFSFLNPNLLGSLNYFRQSFAMPIEKHGQINTTLLLKKMVFPFILRRTKENVAKELPAKTEQTLLCSMNPAQEKLYIQWRDFFRAKILKKIENTGFDEARMNVLEGLTKLRQIACHPHLVDKNIKETSGKFDSLFEIIEEILSENHKILLFSQFVKMLSLIRQILDEENVPYEYLDGRSKNRKDKVDNFQNNQDIKLFLISLKAGGTGLNLTAADYVIHYDPWWNPAVEIQATDRAHRIGQDKKVFVYRLITKDTVEEKIKVLQDKKRKLVKNIISSENSFFKTLEREDIEVLFG